MIESMRRLIQEQRFCVLATCRDNRPHCSLMAYAASPDGAELYLVTHADTRKFTNLQANPLVSLLIDTRSTASGADPGRALTLSGRLAPTPAAEAAADIQARFLQRHPAMAGFVQDPRARWLVIRVENLQLLEGPLEAHHATL